MESRSNWLFVIQILELYLTEDAEKAGLHKLFLVVINSRCPDTLSLDKSTLQIIRFKLLHIYCIIYTMLASLPFNLSIRLSRVQVGNFRTGNTSGHLQEFQSFWLSVQNNFNFGTQTDIFLPNKWCGEKMTLFLEEFSKLKGTLCLVLKILTQ